MLKSIRIKGFRALRDVQLDLVEGCPVVLIGENGSGKTSVLEALEILSALAHGLGGEAIYARGGWEAIRWSGIVPAEAIELEVEFRPGPPYFKLEKGPVRYSVRLEQQRGIPTVAAEQVVVHNPGHDAGFVALQGGPSSFVANVSTKQKDWDVPVSEPNSKLLRNTTLSAVTDASRYPTAIKVKQALQSIAIYRRWELAGGTETIASRPVELTTRIGPDGRNFINAVHSLQTLHSEAWQSFVRDLRSTFPWCQDIKFPPAPGARGQISMTWVDARSGAKLYFDDMSDGLRVFAASIAALRAPEDVELVAFDEPERNLHPRALQRLMKVAEIRSETTPVLFATHSDRLLDFIERPADVLRVCRFDSPNGSRIECVDGHLLEEWLKDYSVSQLRAQDLLDGPVP